MINFLVWYNPATWFDNVSDGLFGALFSGIRLLFNMISVMLYKVMITLYDIFDVLCSARLLDNDILDELSARVGLILGLIMLFYVIFSFIKLLLDPDAITDKTKGAVGIVKRVLIIVVMLGVASFAFRTLFSLQAAIVHNHVISKLVLPYDTDTDKFGNALAAELFTSFYRVDSAFYDDTGEKLSSDWANSNVETCERVVWTLKDQIYDKGDFSLTNTCLNEVAVVNNPNTGNQQETIIDFNWLFMIGVGIAVDYFLISYCIAVGVRMIRLAVLEIISPMAFVSYLAPKQDTMFSKWLKVYFSTYLDVFIRIGIISFAAFLCVTIMDTSGGWEFWNTVNDQPGLKNYIIAFMIVALLTFAKKVPDLLKELGFSGGNFGGFHMKDAFGLQRVAGIATGAATGTAVGVLTAALGRRGFGRVTGALGGAVSGAFRGGVAGAGGKGIFGSVKNAGSSQFKAMKDANSDYNRGATFAGRWGNKISDALTAGQTRIVQLKNEKEDLQTQLRQEKQDITQRKQATAQRKTANTRNHQLAIDGYERRNKSLQGALDAKDNLKKTAVSRALNNKSLAFRTGTEENGNRLVSALRLAESELSNAKKQLENFNSDGMTQAEADAKIRSLQAIADEKQTAYNNAENVLAKYAYDNSEFSEISKSRSAMIDSVQRDSEYFGESGADFLGDSTWENFESLEDFAHGAINENIRLIGNEQHDMQVENDLIAMEERRIEDYEHGIIEPLENQISALDDQITDAESHGGYWGPTRSGSDFSSPGTRRGGPGWRG